MKTRFCPSPTGYMHLGNARTALFSALAAHKEEGVFLLRIEDTDQSRSEEQYVSALLDDLAWMGLDWQEGPAVGGEAAPYWQSQRQPIYDQYYGTLIEKNLAYPCYCSEAQLKLNRKVQRSRGQAPRYPGTCRHLSATDRAAKDAQGLKPTLRFAMPNQQPIEFDDLVRGTQRFFSEDIGDFIIRRTDQTAPFMYCNAIDDALMGVTHVIRGEDHLTNTPRQILILQALGLPVPIYGHISLILGNDGAPLSKRNGSRSVASLREQGYFPEALLNYLARLGHYYKDNHFFDFSSLAEQFAWNTLSRSPARFNDKQLLYWQQQCLQKLSWKRAWEWMESSVSTLVPTDKQEAFVHCIQPNLSFPEDALRWAQVCFDQINYSQDTVKVLHETGVAFFDVALEACSHYGEDFQAIAAHVKESTGNKGKKLFKPLRLAITGEAQGPDMASLLPLMGLSRVMERFQQLIHQLKD